MLVAEVQAKGKRLQAKGQLRPAKFMMELLPAGSGKQTRVPDRRDFDEGQAGEDAWAASVLRGTEGMLGANRTESTDKEHEMFMILISEWSRANGLGALVRKALPDDRVRFRNIAPVYNDGTMKVMRPEALVALLSQMSTGDLRAPKNANVPERRRRLKAHRDQARGKCDGGGPWGLMVAASNG